MLKKLLAQSWFYQIIPLLLWTVFALLPFLFPQNHPAEPLNNGFRYGMFYRNLLMLLVFYLHAYAFFPLLKKKLGLFWYVLSLTLCLTAFLYASEQFRPKMNPLEMAKNMSAFAPKPGMPMPHKEPPFNFFFNTPIFIIIIFSSYCFCVLLNMSERERTLSRRENANLKTELNFLRSQISPHFMFNVLNSMVSLARKRSPLLETSLINMSNLMRYMLYEHNGKSIFLKTEVDYLTNYIDLQLLRYGDTVKLNMYVSGDFEGYSIEPMLLIPFVENSFKHGLSMVEKPLIDIFLTVNQSTNTFQFVVLNNISPVQDMQEGGTGIGLQNIQRRLELLYPERHQLSLSQNDGIYKAELIIKLSA